jgi:branched-chain amino acid transport system substrate-binding protein
LAAEDAMVARGLAKMDWKVPVVATWTASQRSFIELGGPAAEGIRTTVTYIENELGGASREFIQNYRRINNAKTIPSGVAAAQTYDALRLLYLALSLCHCTSGEEIRMALENIEHPSRSTVITRFRKPFSPTEHEGIGERLVFMGEVRKGKVVYAYRDDELKAKSALRD